MDESGEYVLRAEMPGVDPAMDIAVTVADGAQFLASLSDLSRLSEPNSPLTRSPRWCPDH